jgi:sugar lactone lactonase YvrE
VKVHATLPAQGAKGPLRDLNGLAAGPDGSLYFSEDNAIRRIAKDGRVSMLVENVTLPGCAPFFRGLDVDAAGTIYAAATGCNSVVTIASDGKIASTKQVKDAWPPIGVVLAGKDVYVLEFEKKDSDDRHEMLPRIRKILADGTTLIVGTVTHH